MLRYSFHQVRAGSRFYALLPKLNAAQAKILRDRLHRKGFEVIPGEITVARSREVELRISATGACWSVRDPIDFIAPAIPDILCAEKEHITVERLSKLYFDCLRSGGGTVVRLVTRVEHSGIWRALRAADVSGLTPDECAAAKFFLGGARGPVGLVSDFPTSSGKVKQMGRRRYYESDIPGEEASRSVRALGERLARNVYLQPNCMIRLRPFTLPRRAALVQLLEGMGEWCGYAPE